MNGILIINKAAGMTSFAVVSRVKRITGEKHCGHAGTLDPLATGILPICLGQSTRILEYLFNETKTYLAKVKLGVTTDSYDSEGKTLHECDASNIERPLVESVLPKFRGDIRQTPPMYSALKHNGQPLYKLARQGIEIERESRAITIFRLEITGWQPPFFDLEIECSKGTYIRSLAHDIGQTLGCGAIMQNLTRTRVGAFSIESALTLEQLEDSFKKGEGTSLLYPADYALNAIPSITVNHEQQKALVNGQTITQFRKDTHSNQLVRIYNCDGRFVGMARYMAENDLWKPEKIFIQ